ncbi:hypothetical protein MMC21_001291 [Puttea exsequens]|nr:hypothetical protein [Puttea exsequens]
MPTPQSSPGSVVDQSVPELHVSPGPAQDITLEDLGLMHLYSISTWHSLDDVPEVREIWQELVPQEAVSQPYLMHGLLAMAALHKISLGVVDSAHYLALAMKHHSLALAKSKLELENISEHNCHALFAFSAITAIYTLALPVSQNAVMMEDPVKKIASTAIMMRGSSTIVQSHLDDIRNGKYGILVRSDFHSDNLSMPRQMAAVLSDLKTQVRLHDKDQSNLTGCSLAFERLRICFVNMHFDPEAHTISVDSRDRAVMWSFLATVDTEFISLLFANEPMALILLAHYAVLLHSLNGMWWCRGWGISLIRSISGLLGKDWEPTLRWPMKQIGLEAGYVPAV